jgi:hypothetical protein
MNERPPPDISLAVDTGIRWMSYQDIAAARGVSVASVTRMVRRKKWRRQPGNGATVLVAVPLAALARTEPRTKSVRPGQSEVAPGQPSPGQNAPPSPGQEAAPSPDIEALVRGFEAAITALREQSEAEAKGLRGQIDATERHLADKRAEALALYERLTAERRRADRADWRAASAEAERGRLREADAARRSGGLLARLRAALRRR